ncbi:hypothetical protein VTN77DRAFT_4503 [Rasamsonia byssochlamydoides]|uniref:uncharacterized protein n=1 Tax=Rasamsonia byssochlamydoides TaxID=89139 RepID=UPI00374262F2
MQQNAGTKEGTAFQGLQHHRRTRLWESLVSEDGVPNEIVCHFQEPEARTLLQLYAPWTSQPSTLETDETTNQADERIKKLLKVWRVYNMGGVGDSRLHEEQEREIAQEVQRQHPWGAPG